MSKHEIKPRISAATQLAQEVARSERLKPEQYHEDAKATYARGREMGLNEREIEELFGISPARKNKSET